MKKQRATARELVKASKKLTVSRKAKTHQKDFHRKTMGFYLLLLFITYKADRSL